MDRPVPTRSLDPHAQTLWRLNNLVWGVVPLAVMAAGGGFILWQVVDWALWQAAVPLIAVVVLGIPLALLLPGAEWRNWRYDVGEDEVDLMRGLITKRRTLVPMARIQHVDTRRGPLERYFGLSSVVLYTAAGANEIPALATPTAEALRDQIAAIANTYDDL